MEVITPEIINSFLRAHLDKLSGEELVSLRQLLKHSSKIEELPVSLRENLHLRDYLLIRNLVEVVLEEFDKLVPTRCSMGKLLTTMQSQWITEKIEELKTKWLDQWKENDGNNIVDELVDEEEEVSTPLLEYTHHLFSKILESLRGDDVVITPKQCAESSRITLVVQQPVMTLSKCKDEVGKWVNTLRGRLAQVHFIAQEVFYVDCGLDNATWQGVNILVISRKFECSTANGNVWDVSGGPGENGGSLLFLFDKFHGLDHLKIITKGGNTSGEEENSKPGNNYNMTTLFSLFPPSAHSTSLRRLVFENAINHFGKSTLKHFLFKPEGSYDPIEKQVIGPIYDFYMEGETDYGMKFYLGYRKGWIAKNAFCLLQQTNSRGNAKGVLHCGGPGQVNFFSMKKLEEASTEKLGVEIITDKVTKSDMSSNEGQDVGYVMLSPNQIIKYPPGNYQFKIEDAAMPDSVHCVILGKHVAISDKVEPVSNSQSETPNEIFVEPSIAMKMYPLFESDEQEKLVKTFMLRHENTWWESKILNDN